MNEGAKAAAHAAADAINENIDTLKDKAGKKLNEAKKKASASVDDLCVK